MVDISEVLNSARDLFKPSKTMVSLVYASEDALAEPKIPLPGPVNRFLKLDQRRFHQELQEEGQLQGPTLAPGSRPPTPSSMATNRDSDNLDLSSREGDFDREEDPNFMNPFENESLITAGAGGDRVTEIRMEEGEAGFDVVSTQRPVESPVLGRDEAMRQEKGEADNEEELPAYETTAGSDVRMGGTTPEVEPANRAPEAPMEEMKDVSTKPLFLQHKNQGADDDLPSMGMGPPHEGST
jgi:hypothetical protein